MADPAALPLIASGRYPQGTCPWQRGIGCVWSSDGTVTVLVSPDDGDHCRAVLRLTYRAAADLAEELERCAKWARESSIREEAPDA